ncbi:uncharacterized protein [Nicotiana tomentosiformis]|uniref:uncharacterized protein n=1 Tax=Nicotiana tomentosiformis TaxID=4098 RepID=UPI00388C50B5
MRWVLLLKEFDIDIQEKKESKIQVANYLSHLEEEGRPHDGLEINDSFLDEQLLALSMKEVPWFADLANFLVSGIIPDEFSSNKRKKLKRDCQDYYWDKPYLFQIYTDGVIQRCVPEEEQCDILGACHSLQYGGYHGGVRTTAKVLSCGFYWTTLYKDSNELVKICDCQWAGKHLHFGTPRGIISDGGSHFCNKDFDILLGKYGVTQKVTTPYHPQASGQVESPIGR